MPPRAASKVVSTKPMAASVPVSIFCLGGSAGLAGLAAGGRLGGRRQLGIRCRIRRGGALGHLLLDHPHQLLVGRQERLPDADRVIDDLGDGGVPVAALAVEEDAVAADHEVVRVAAGERGDDLHLLARALALAVAIGEVGARQAGHGGVFAGVFDREAQVAAALVQVERAGLEDGLVLAAVEVAEGDEVVAELVRSRW